MLRSLASFSLGDKAVVGCWEAVGGWKASRLDMGWLCTHCVGWPARDPVPPCTPVSVPVLEQGDGHPYILTASSGVQIILSSSLLAGGLHSLCFVHWRGGNFWFLVPENLREWLGSRGHSPELAGIPARGTPSVYIFILTIPRAGLLPRGLHALSGASDPECRAQECPEGLWPGGRDVCPGGSGST